MIILKVTKNQAFTLSQKNTYNSILSNKSDPVISALAGAN